MMKTIRQIFPVNIFFIFFLISCWSFLSIDQPDLADPNSSFDVPITISLTAEDKGGRGYFGILLPIGWSAEESISYTGVHNGTFIYSSAASDSMEAFENAPEEYYWWVSVSDSVDLLSEGSITFSPRIHTDDQSGTFFIDYILTDRFDPGYFRRSDDHPISVNIPMTAAVTNTNDSGEGSLRQALSSVSSSGEIVFNLSYPATIELKNPLELDRSLTITGPGSGQLTISGNNQTRVFSIHKNLNVKLSNITVSNGIEGGILCYNSSLSLDNVTIVGNAGENGGGINISDTDLNLKDVIIKNNTAEYDGGGIYCYKSNLSFSNVTITNNIAGSVGGGITFFGKSNIYFSSDSLCNIYSNKAFLGNDLYSDNHTLIDVVLDTFTVLYPTSYHAYLPRNFSFNILNAKVIQYDSDLYISLNGDNSNSGISPAVALKNISFAFSKIMTDSLNPHKIYIDDGIYGPSANGEDFPLRIPNYVTLSGTKRDDVILDAEGSTCVIQIFLDDYAWGTSPRERYMQMNNIENMTITGGNASGIQCWESILNMNNVTITENSSENNSYGGGITCEHANINLKDVIISNNTSDHNGGGIMCSASEADLSNVLVMNNTAENWGGGIHPGNSTLKLSAVKIKDNSARAGGGLIGHVSDISLAGVSITNNSARDGGGLYISSSDPSSKVIFSHENRCNIYSNNAAVHGVDLYYEFSYDSTIIVVIVDTFSVLNPTQNNAYLLENFTFDILHNASGLHNQIADNDKVPIKFALAQNYPNPFNPITTIEFSIPKSEYVEVKVYNIIGREVSTLLQTKLNSGNHSYTFDGKNLASGVYYYQLVAGDYRRVKKMILLK